MQNIFLNLFRQQKVLFNIDPGADPPYIPGDGGGGGTSPGSGNPTTSPSFVAWMTGYATSRYTLNLAVTEEVKCMDLINEVILPSFRGFCSQNSKGQLKLQNKKPVTWGLGVSSFLTDAVDIELDDISGWVDNSGNLILIDPYTTLSEVHSISGLSYDAAQNSVSLSASANMTVTGFSGASGLTPATASITVDDPDDGNPSNVTLDSISIDFTATASDTVDGLANFIAVTINAHPKLGRRFRAYSSSDTVLIVGKFGTLTLAEPILADHAAPIANPTVAPTLTATASGSLLAGVYKVAYSYVNFRGQTLLSPVQSVTLVDGEKITVTGVTPPAGCTVNWYVQPQPGSKYIRLHSNNDGSGFVIDSLPLLTATLPPDFNRTGAEVMRIMASFTDRYNARARALSSNVLRGSFEWLLGNRNKTVNRVDLKYRRALEDYRLIELRVSDLANIAKTKKTSNIEINGQAIDNDFQATRIALGILAEFRDADFFYKWKATRGSLLLEEGDVVAITDSGSGVINLPVMIEQIDYDLAGAGLPKASYTGRKFANTLYDDSVSERRLGNGRG